MTLSGYQVLTMQIPPFHRNSDSPLKYKPLQMRHINQIFWSVLSSEFVTFVFNVSFLITIPQLLRTPEKFAPRLVVIHFHV